MTILRKPQFSIIIPTLNRSWCIERAINSVLAQSFDDWELLVVDDGSTDETRLTVEGYLVDDRVRYYFKDNGGVGSARNHGLKFANGEFIMFLDSDDEFSENAFVHIRSAISRHAESKMFSFGAVDQDGRRVSYSRIAVGETNIGFADFLSGKYIVGEAFLVYRKGIFDGKSFEEGVNGGEELLLLGLIKENGLMLMTEDVRIYHLGTSDSLVTSRLTSEKVLNTRRIQELLLERYAEDLRRYNRKSLGIAYLVLARMMALSGRRVSSLRYFMFGLIYDSFDAKRVFLYLISLFDFGFRLNNSVIGIVNKINYD